MTSLNEFLDIGGDGNTLKPDLLSGLRTLSGDQKIIFTQYTKYVLPLDGFIFWLRTDTQEVSGILHYDTEKQQNEDETIAVNRIMFTTGQPIQAFDEIAPNVIWVGEFRGAKFAFSSQSGYLENADIHHYYGDAVYPALESQLVDMEAKLSKSELVVSNSLPAWLTIPTYNPFWMTPKNPGILLYPSYAVPDNLRPPYGTVHIDPEQTQSLQSAPYLDRRTDHYQLALDVVRITAYGWTNSNALDFLDVVNQYSIDQNVIGLRNVPTWRDEKRTQPELGILAMKKTITFEVNYYQTRINNIARQLIEHAKVKFIPYPGE